MTDIENQKAILLGIIQGISEFLPISSSGHLVLFQSLFGHFNDLTFEIFVQDSYPRNRVTTNEAPQNLFTK